MSSRRAQKAAALKALRDRRSGLAGAPDSTRTDDYEFQYEGDVYDVVCARTGARARVALCVACGMPAARPKKIKNSGTPISTEPNKRAKQARLLGSRV